MMRINVAVKLEKPYRKIVTKQDTSKILRRITRTRLSYENHTFHRLTFIQSTHYFQNQSRQLPSIYIVNPLVCFIPLTLISLHKLTQTMIVAYKQVAATHINFCVSPYALLIPSLSNVPTAYELCTVKSP
jgi:hypothetical protein